MRAVYDRTGAPHLTSHHTITHHSRIPHTSTHLPPHSDLYCRYAPYGHGPADYRAFKAMHVSLLRSAHRTADPKAAHYFYIPAWDFHGAWGNPEVYWRASTRD